MSTPPTAQAALSALNALQQLRNQKHPTLTSAHAAALNNWPGWGALANIFDHHRTAPPWKDIAQTIHDTTPNQHLRFAHEATPTSYYTPTWIIDALYTFLDTINATTGNALEPGCGHGRFLTRAPHNFNLNWVGIERDPTSARIAELLHPHATIHAAPLETMSITPHSMDLVIGNVPFGRIPIHDPLAPDTVTTNLHNYFLWRAVHALRPGGYATLLTSRYTLDSRHSHARHELHALADLIGAFRLPGHAFAESGTNVVTDLLILRRRHPHETPSHPTWLDTATITHNTHTATISQYYLDHPHHILGDLALTEPGMHGHNMTVTHPGNADDLADNLARSLADLADTAPRHVPTDQPADALLSVTLTDNQGRKEGSHHIEDNTVVRIIDGNPIPCPPHALPELRALINLRDTALDLLSAEADDADPAHIDNLRARLNADYDHYADTYGPINRCTLRPGPADPETGLPTQRRTRPRLGGFSRDPDYPTVLALENYDSATNTATKPAIFYRRLNTPAEAAPTASSLPEAFARSLDTTATVDVDYIAELLNRDPDDVADELVATGIAYPDPDSAQKWVPANQYLSGDVRAKLAAAKLAARDDTTYQANVSALETVQPADIPPERIAAHLGAPWIPERYVREFVADILEDDTVEVAHSTALSTWKVTSNRRHASYSVPATVTWGTARVHAYRLVEMALNNQTPTVETAREAPQLDSQDTLVARQRQDAIQERFRWWVWEDPDRADVLARLYNRMFNSHVHCTYSGDHLTFPGMSPDFVPYAWQRDIAWRAVMEPSVAAGHAIGAGKTAEALMIAMTLRRLGLISKPVLTVLNHDLEDTVSESKRIYPYARILSASSTTITNAHDRKVFAARCATEEWDLIVMTHSMFSSLRLHPAAEAEYRNAEVDALRHNALAIGDEDKTHQSLAKQVARRCLARDKKVQDLLASKRDDGVTFDQLGCDYLLVDELQYFRNLRHSTRVEGFTLPGSARATDLHMKLRYLRSRSRTNRVFAGFTGTPIANSLREVFVLQTYFRPDRLHAAGIDTLDAWASMFVNLETQVEVTPNGAGFRLHRRPRSITNLPELSRMLSEFLDIVPTEALDLDLPTVHHHKIVVPRNDTLDGYVAELVERSERIHTGAPATDNDNMLVVCLDGRKASTDLNLVGVHDPAPAKLVAAADNIARVYHHHGVNDLGLSNTFQLAYCDIGTPKKGDRQTYGRLRKMLIDRNVPAHTIRIVHDATTDHDKAALFDTCRTGHTAVLLGSTLTAGVGVNIQDRCAAVHHIDAPWLPSDIDQRNGRMRRQGNTFDQVDSYVYIAEGSFDAYLWQTLERKARFIAEVLLGTVTMREVDDLDRVVWDYIEFKVAATGNPVLRELAEVEGRLFTTEGLIAAHERDQRRLHALAAEAERSATAATAEAETWTKIAHTSLPSVDAALARALIEQARESLDPLTAPAPPRPIPWANGTTVWAEASQVGRRKHAAVHLRATTGTVRIDLGRTLLTGTAATVAAAVNDVLSAAEHHARTCATTAAEKVEQAEQHRRQARKPHGLGEDLTVLRHRRDVLRAEMNALATDTSAQLQAV